MLLSQIRRYVPHRRFRILLELQLAGDRWFVRRYLVPDFEIVWVQEMEIWIEIAFDALEGGRNMMPILRRIVHLYGHLFR